MRVFFRMATWAALSAGVMGPAGRGGSIANEPSGKAWDRLLRSPAGRLELPARTKTPSPRARVVCDTPRPARLASVRPWQNGISNEPQRRQQPSLGFVPYTPRPTRSQRRVERTAECAVRARVPRLLRGRAGRQAGVHERPGRPRRGEPCPARMKGRAGPRRRCRRARRPGTMDRRWA